MLLRLSCARAPVSQSVCLRREFCCFFTSSYLKLPLLSLFYNLPHAQMVEVLKISPTDLEKTVIDTANSFIEQGIIKKSKKSLKKEKGTTEGDAAAVVAAGDAATEEGTCASEFVCLLLSSHLLVPVSERGSVSCARI